MLDLQTGFLIEMAIVIAVAAIIVILFNRFRQPLILGYLVAGMVVGPFVVGAEFSIASESTGETMVVTAEPIIQMMARLGIVLLTFSIGLEFSFKQLRKIGITVIAAASVEIILTFGIGYQLGLALGWGVLESSLLGAMLSISSTMIIVRSLKESGGLDNERAHLVIGLLVVEDFAAVLILAIVSGFVTEGAITTSQVTELLIKMGIFLAASIVIGLAVVPRLVDYVGRQRSTELLVLTVIGLCFSMAVFARWIGISEAIGAFVMGVIVSESKFLGDVVRRIEPIRDLFGAIFFITVGMLVDLSLFLEPAFLVGALLITAVFVLAKMFSCTLSTFMFGFGARNSLGAGLSMVSIGEFSLMIAAVAIGSNAIDPDLSIYETIVVVTTLSALIVPYSVKYSDKVTRAVESLVPRSFLVMATYLNLLVRNVRRRSRTSLRLSNEMRDSITRLFIYIILMATTLIAATNAVAILPDLEESVGINEDMLLLILLTGTLIVVAATMYGVWSRSIRLIEISTSEAMLSTKSAENIGYHDTAKALRWVFLAIYTVIGFIIVSPMIQSIIQQGTVFALIAVFATAVAGVAMWRSVKTIDKKLEETFEHRGYATPDSSSDLAEIEEIIAALERGTR